MFLGSEFWIKMSRSDKFYEEYSKIQENSTYEYIPTKKMYDDIITFLISGKADEKYNEQQVFKDLNWKKLRVYYRIEWGQNKNRRPKNCTCKMRTCIKKCKLFGLVAA